MHTEKNKQETKTQWQSCFLVHPGLNVKGRLSKTFVLYMTKVYYINSAKWCFQENKS